MSIAGPYIASMIYSSLTTRLNHSLLDNINLTLRLIPGEELPWYSVIHKFYEAGQLNNLLHWFSTSTGLPSSACFSHPTSAAHYIGEAGYLYHTLTRLPLRLVILCHYQMPNITCHLLPIYKALIWNVYKEHYAEVLKTKRSWKLIHGQIINPYKPNHFIQRLAQQFPYIASLVKYTIGMFMEQTPLIPQERLGKDITDPLEAEQEDFDLDNILAEFEDDTHQRLEGSQP